MKSTSAWECNKLLARFLAGHAAELDLRLVDFNGGTLRNAIPREAFAPLR
ncbi:Cytosol non-specific dipeptidase [Raoultella terrigena]|uniref:Cytosol non-specific dipeptidase n=1 Tax=Raoultella terrigena TaxID=577 RepID=A0A4U9D6M0_RAOTE|nr:Cytosol non-specific dipeptidase [Raoultella terrigena]